MMARMVAAAAVAGMAAEMAAAAATAAEADHPHIHPCTTISHFPLPHNFILKFYIFIMRLFCI